MDESRMATSWIWSRNEESTRLDVEVDGKSADVVIRIGDAQANLSEPKARELAAMIQLAADESVRVKAGFPIPDDDIPF